MFAVPRLACLNTHLICIASSFRRRG